ALQGGERPRVLVLGVADKERVPDGRNSRALCVAGRLAASGCVVEVHDPHRRAGRPAPVPPRPVSAGPCGAILLLLPNRGAGRDARATSPPWGRGVLRPEVRPLAAPFEGAGKRCGAP